MDYASDARTILNEARDVNTSLVREVAEVVRQQAAQAAAYKARSLIDPIPSSIPADVADAAYAMLANRPYSFRVSCEHRPDGSVRWSVSW
jgi:hypothetical protein